MSNHPRESCSSCHFFEQARNGQGNICTKSPPAAQFIVVPKDTPTGMMPVVQLFSGWPPVSQHDWCGEHKQDILIAH
ncbi:MAG: hypothetical protein AABY01_02190 [Nanoarchaeota archaeon]